MCYPLPGPRCSAHAAAAYAKAHQKVLHEFMYEKDSKKLDKLIKARDKAKAEYAITPAGIREKEQDAAAHPDIEWRQRAVVEAKAERQRRLDLVKGQEQIKHTPRAGKGYISTSFSTPGAKLEEMPYNHPDLLASIKDSEKWSHSLTAEEHAVVAWYSQGGYGEVNGRLQNPEHYNQGYNKNLYKRTPEETDVLIGFMDSAFAKHQPGKTGVVVYRRHLLHGEDGLMVDANREMIEQQFKEGSVYEPGFFLSTSLNPDNLHSHKGSSSEHVLQLEIKTKTGVPITAVSSQGPREYEFLIPRNAKFRVVSNNTKVLNQDDGSWGEISIIQLEEI